MPYETLLTDLSENIFTITINRPDKLNALNTQMIRDVLDAFDEADANDAVRAIIVTGAGRAFCAGADLSTGAKTFDREARPDRPQVPNGPDGKPDLTHENARDGGGRMTLAHLQLQQAGDRGRERAGGRHRRHHAAADGRAHRVERGALRLRVLAARHRAGGGIELLPAAPRRHRAGARLVLLGPRVRRRGGARRKAGEPRGAAGGLIATARAIARRYIDKTAPVSVALIRQMMWRMLGAAHPMEAHRIDSRAMFHRGRSADVKEGITSVPGKAPRALHRHGLGRPAGSAVGRGAGLPLGK